MGECYIAGNVAKHSGEYPQIFRGMLLNIPWNVPKPSGECWQTVQKCRRPECPQVFMGVLSNIPRNAAKHFGDCPQAFWRMSVLLTEMGAQAQSNYYY